jgi:hypothetical protein
MTIVDELPPDSGGWEFNQSTQYVKAHEVEPHSSRDIKMQEYLMTNKFYDIMELANESYNRVLGLYSTKKDRFVL